MMNLFYFEVVELVVDLRWICRDRYFLGLTVGDLIYYLYIRRYSSRLYNPRMVMHVCMRIQMSL